MKQHRVVLWSVTGIAALLVALAAIVGGSIRTSRTTADIRDEANQRVVEATRIDQKLCESVNTNKAALRTLVVTINDAARQAFLQTGLTPEQIDQITADFAARTNTIIGPDVVCGSLKRQKT